MESRSTGKWTLGTVVVGVLLLGAALGVGAYALHANRGRQQQLHDDEIGRQRDEVLNAAQAKGARVPPPQVPATAPSGG